MDFPIADFFPCESAGQEAVVAQAAMPSSLWV
jgi:hypothetical protein